MYSNDRQTVLGYHGRVACTGCGSLNIASHYQGCPVESHNKLSALVAELRNRIDILERKHMSAAMWCDPGKHAFSANDEGIESLTRTKVVKDDNYGGKHEVTYQIHICGEHIQKLDPFNEHEDAAKKTKELEAWNEGYEEGRKAGGSDVTINDTT